MSRYDRPSHQVYMYFFLRSGWQVQFTEADLKTPLPRKLTFTDPEKIRELARRGEAWGPSPRPACLLQSGKLHEMDNTSSRQHFKRTRARVNLKSPSPQGCCSVPCVLCGLAHESRNLWIGDL
jgi:hypothetical protein